MSWYRKVDEEEETAEFDETSEGHVPAGWRPGQDTVAAIEGDDARAAAEEALELRDVSGKYAYARRYSSEAAARAAIGVSAVDLDQAARDGDLGLKGGNYPTYDVSSEQEVASVKTHWGNGGELTDSAVAIYKSDFLKQFGWRREVGAVMADGANITAARDSGVPVPPELHDASAEEAAAYLREESALRIPDDHVAPVRDAIAEEARIFPETYGLEENTSEEDIQHLTGRIRGIGLTSAELEHMIVRRMGRA